MNAREIRSRDAAISDASGIHGARAAGTRSRIHAHGRDDLVWCAATDARSTTRSARVSCSHPITESVAGSSTRCSPAPAPSERATAVRIRSMWPWPNRSTAPAAASARARTRRARGATSSRVSPARQRILPNRPFAPIPGRGPGSRPWSGPRSRRSPIPAGRRRPRRRRSPRGGRSPSPARPGSRAPSANGRPASSGASAAAAARPSSVSGDVGPARVAPRLAPLRRPVPHEPHVRPWCRITGSSFRVVGPRVSLAHPRVKRSVRWNSTRSPTSSTTTRTRPTGGSATTSPATATTALGFYALSRYADVLDASQQPLLYSSAEGTMVERLDTKAMLPMMIFMDPPEHDVQRKLVSRAFTPRAISELEPFVRQTAIDCLEPLVEQGGGDFVEEFSAVLPMNVIMELLGVPAADRNTLRHWMDATLDRLEEPPYIPDHAIEAMGKTGAYWQRSPAREARAPRRRLHLEAVRSRGRGRRRLDRAADRRRGDRVHVADRLGRHRDAHEAARQRGGAVPSPPRRSGERSSPTRRRSPARSRRRCASGPRRSTKAACSPTT